MSLFPRSLALGAVSFGLFACSAIPLVIPSFEVDGSASIVNEQGIGLGGSYRKLSKSPADGASSLNHLKYQSTVVHATFTVGADAIHGALVNKTELPMTIRFDEATLSSFFNAGVPMQVAYAQLGAHVVTATAAMPAKAPALTLSPAETAAIRLVPSYAGLYPSGQLFNMVSRPGGPALTEAPEGRTLTLKIPIERQGGRLLWVIELNAMQAQTSP